MNVVQTVLGDCLLLEPRIFADERGFFFESYNSQTLENIGIKSTFVQDNHSRSKRNVIRGLHYQVMQPQGKLVRVVCGDIFDVVVDLRRGSPFFGQWAGVKLSDQTKQMLWIPAGFAHGFLTLSDQADLLYKTTEFYAPQHERTIVWNDTELKIDWPLQGAPIISQKDRAGCAFRAAETFV